MVLDTAIVGRIGELRSLLIVEMFRVFADPASILRSYSLSTSIKGKGGQTFSDCQSEGWNGTQRPYRGSQMNWGQYSIVVYARVQIDRGASRSDLAGKVNVCGGASFWLGSSLR
jgi:hypothetical protein